MAESEKAVPLAVSLPESLIAEIDRVAADVKDSRSGAMRRAIRAGLPLVKSGGEVVRLSGELADFVGELATHHRRSREAVLASAVKHGLEAVNVELMVEEARAKGTDEASLAIILAHHENDLRPEKRAAHTAIRERAALQIQMSDLLQHCPEAMRRKESIEKLIEIRRTGGQWLKVWGCGLSNEEIRWQIEMAEKYGHDSANWPKEETTMRDLAREAERKAAGGEVPPVSPKTEIPGRAVEPQAATPAAAKPSKRKAGK